MGETKKGGKYKENVFLFFFSIFSDHNFFHPRLFVFLIFFISLFPNQQQQLRTVFLAYAAYGARRPSGSSLPAGAATIAAFPAAVAAGTAEIDGARFSKLVRAAGLLDSKKPSSFRLTPADVDLTFAQACASSGSPATKRLRFDEFVGALRSLSARAGCGGGDASDLMSAIAASGGPRPSGEATVPDFVRFHDDKVRNVGKEEREKEKRKRGGEREKMERERKENK